MLWAFHFSLSSSHLWQLSKHSRNHLGRSRSSAAFHSSEDRILYAVCLLLWLHLDAISIPLSATSVLRGCSFHSTLLLWRCLVRHVSEGLHLPSRLFHALKSLYDLFLLELFGLWKDCLKCQLRLFWTLPHSAHLFSLKHVWVIWRSTECRLCARQLLLKGSTSGAQWYVSLGLLSFSFMTTLSDHTWEGYLGPWAR